MSSTADVLNYFSIKALNNVTARSDPPYMAGAFVSDRVFGGLAVSQAVNSFMTLNPACIPHTINYKFVNAARTATPLTFTVTDHPEGSIASVAAYQEQKIVGMGHVRYSPTPVDYLDSSPMLCPEYIQDPESYPTAVELVEMMGKGDTASDLKALSHMAMEIRPVESPKFPQADHGRRTALWLRIKDHHHEALNLDHGLAVALFLSDFAILNVASEIYAKAGKKINTGASLHHSIWIHEKSFDPCAFYLTVVDCHVISHERARLESYIFTRDRKCVMSVVQEGYIQVAANHKL